MRRDFKMRLTKSDKRELTKFIKFLTLKATEVIVQSRLGERVSTPCKLHSNGPSWFNLNISDNTEIGTEAKRVLNSEHFLSNNDPYCVEISLRTAEGDSMVLESWCIRLLPEQCDASTANGQTIYNRMAILLRSLVSVTRVTPAYKLSRRQGPDSYVMCYRMYMSEPIHHCLGEGFKESRIGQICTPIGTLQLSCAYRTKMTISPTQNSRDNSILLKSDHFNTNMSPKNRRYSQSDERTASLSETMKIGAFADKKKKLIEDPQLETPFFSWFAEKVSLNDHGGSDNNVEETVEQNHETEQKSCSNNDDDLNSKNDVIVETMRIEKNGNNQQPQEVSMVSTGDDFIMVDLKTPFAKQSGEKTELAKIFREWQQAPVLETFKDLPPLEVTDLQQQLENYESDMHEFENIVSTILYHNSPNNN